MRFVHGRGAFASYRTYPTIYRTASDYRIQGSDVDEADWVVSPLGPLSLFPKPFEVNGR